ncbi:hypothetical protein D3C73_1487360 [compost metagenome]
MATELLSVVALLVCVGKRLRPEVMQRCADDPGSLAVAFERVLHRTVMNRLPAPWRAEQRQPSDGPRQRLDSRHQGFKIRTHTDDKPGSGLLLLKRNTFLTDI